MAKSKAKTVRDYIAELPADRRADITALRKLILQNLPDGYEEALNWGMLCYQIPLKRYPNTYNGKPLGYVALASQKQYMSLYLMNVYGDPQTQAWFAEGFKKAGKKLDMGKSCVRFKRLDDLPLDVIAQAVARTSVAQYLAHYEKVHKPR